LRGLKPVRRSNLLIAKELRGNRLYARLEKLRNRPRFITSPSTCVLSARETLSKWRLSDKKKTGPICILEIFLLVASTTPYKTRGWVLRLTDLGALRRITMADKWAKLEAYLEKAHNKSSFDPVTGKVQ